MYAHDLPRRFGPFGDDRTGNLHGLNVGRFQQGELHAPSGGIDDRIARKPPGRDALDIAYHNGIGNVVLNASGDENCRNARRQTPQIPIQPFHPRPPFFLFHKCTVIPKRISARLSRKFIFE